jgi:fluoride exporter
MNRLGWALNTPTNLSDEQRPRVHPLIAIGAGAVLGAWARWGLALALNKGAGQMWPLGTLAANAIGGLLIGFCVAFFSARSTLDPAWRLFAVTGFLGALTTFSTYSAEVIDLLQRGAWLSGLGLALVHVIVSLVLCVAGFWLYKYFS